MFENLTNKLSSIFSKFKKNLLISEKDLDESINEIRTAFLEADVSLAVADQLIEQIRKESIGQQVIKSISPAQMIVKIVHQVLTNTLSDDRIKPITLDGAAKRIMLVGLQGSGKTTTAAKLVNFLTKNSNKKALLTSVDIYRPAAVKQLEILARDVNASFTSADPSKDKPMEILDRALKQAQTESHDLFILDTAGRLHTDAQLMDELRELKKTFKPDEILLVVDSMTGQDAFNIATEFNANIGLTGLVISRMDGDPRGGVAISMKMLTSVPIRYIGVGEKVNQLEIFDPKRAADRILDMGDIVSLVEHAQEAQDKDDERIINRMQNGYFDLNDLAHHFKKIQKMGGFAKLLSFLPGVGNMGSLLQNRGFDDGFMKRNLAIISSMTKFERRNPDVLKNSRKLRIAAGSGTSVQEINKLLKQHEQMYKLVRKMKNMPKDKIASMFNNFM